jgi:hypothetical protein
VKFFVSPFQGLEDSYEPAKIKIKNWQMERK